MGTFFWTTGVIVTPGGGGAGFSFSEEHAPKNNSCSDKHRDNVRRLEDIRDTVLPPLWKDRN
jgi:hypothetical protein